MSPAHKALRLLLACLLIVGTSDGVLGALRCGLGRCAPNCEMHQSLERAKPAESCCKQKKAQTKTTQKAQSCKCEMKASPEAAIGTPALTVPMVHQLDWGPVSATLDGLQAPAAERVPVLHRGDSSPPIVFYHPDSGRAPPIA